MPFPLQFFFVAFSASLLNKDALTETLSFHHKSAQSAVLVRILPGF